MKPFHLLLLLACFFSLFSQAQTIPSYVPTNGLVGWWPFNGNANDESGNGNNGTVNGATLTTDRNGNVNSAYSFDGVNDGIVASDLYFPMGSTDRSITFWMKDESIGTYCSIPIRYGSSSPSNGCWILHSNLCNSNYPNGTLLADFYNSGVWSNSTMPNNEWRMITMSLKNQNCCIYLDSTIVGQGSVSVNTISLNNQFYIGGDLINFFNGSIDDIAIYNRALTQQEITALYTSTPPCNLSITTQPTNQSATTGNHADFNIGITTNCNNTTSYQWQTNLGFGWQTLQNAGQYTGVNTDHLQVSNIGTNNTNQQFRCIVSSGNLSDTSQAASINIINSSNNANSGITHAIPYQAVVRDGNGNLLSNHSLQVRCTLHDSNASGNIIYQETHSISTNNLGLFTLQIGTGTPVVSSIDSINWALYKKFIQIEVDTTSQGTSYTDLGTQQLMAVPYALYAETAGNALNGPKGDKGEAGVNGTNGINGQNGTNGVNGVDGISVTSANITNDSLYLSLSNSQIVNAGKMSGGTLPTVTTGSVTNLQPNSVNIIGNNCSNSGGTFLAKGICLSTNPNPTIDDMRSTISFFDGTFSANLSDLNTNTTYYFRAFAINHLGVSYGVESSFTTLIQIGSPYQGGYIAYILQPGDIGFDPNIPHGIIVAPSDQSIDVTWGIGGLAGTNYAIGTGNANTNSIVSFNGAGNYAANLCYDLVLNGYSDWYLPSRDELNKLYLNQNAIGMGTNFVYWSSSEETGSHSWIQYFSNGFQDQKIKNHGASVRAVRSF